jgi:hypothetical protein
MVDVIDRVRKPTPTKAIISITLIFDRNSEPQLGHENSDRIDATFNVRSQEGHRLTSFMVHHGKCFGIHLAPHHKLAGEGSCMIGS